MGSPPAPPLPFNGFNNCSKQQDKNVPPSKGPMKVFNWIKIPANSYQDSMWVKSDLESLYKLLDFEEFENTFSASSNIQETDVTYSLSCENSLETTSLTSISNKIKKNTVVTDGKRANNILIYLTTFKKKFTNERLEELILDMDTYDQLPKDEIEQLLKYVPTESEESLLNNINEADLVNMPDQDRFLLDISRIFHYKQKLEVLYFKKKYTERFRELKTKIIETNKCCDVLLKNKNIRTLLEIVLCMGNFMNQGNRNGTARGLSISNLKKLIDIKSSSIKSYTLLHYLIDTIEKKFPEVLNISQELDSVSEISKINLENLHADLKSLENGFTLLESELNDHKVNYTKLKDTDQFIDKMTKFTREHTQDINLLKESFSEMQSNFKKTLKYFGENEAKTNFETFFSNWNEFLVSFIEIRSNITTRRSSLKENERKEEKISHKSYPSLTKFTNPTKMEISTENNVNPPIEDCFANLPDVLAEDDLPVFISNLKSTNQVPSQLRRRPKYQDYDYHLHHNSNRRERVHSICV